MIEQCLGGEWHDAVLRIQRAHQLAGFVVVGINESRHEDDVVEHEKIEVTPVDGARRSEWVCGAGMSMISIGFPLAS